MGRGGVRKHRTPGRSSPAARGPSRRRPRALCLPRRAQAVFYSHRGASHPTAGSAPSAACTPERRMARANRRLHLVRRAALFALAAAGALAPGRAEAQQHTFHLDRLEVPGAPDDGIALFRPVTRVTPEQTIFYGQLALGFSLDPLRTSNVTNNASALQRSPTNLVTTQLSTYMSAGFELLERLTLGATLPIAW